MNLKNILASLALAVFLVAPAAAASKSSCRDAGKCAAACCKVACCDSPCCAGAKDAKLAKFSKKPKAAVLAKGKKAGSCCDMPCCNGGACCSSASCK